MNKRLKLKNIIAENIGNKQVNIRKGIKFGNKILEEKNIGGKHFLNNSERNFRRKKLQNKIFR